MLLRSIQGTSGNCNLACKSVNPVDPVDRIDRSRRERDRRRFLVDLFVNGDIIRARCVRGNRFIFYVVVSMTFMRVSLHFSLLERELSPSHVAARQIAHQLWQARFLFGSVF